MPAHPHSYPTGDETPPSPEIVTRRRRASWLMLLVLVPIGLATVVGLIALWPSGDPSRAQQAAETFQPPGTSYPDATVQSLDTYDCSDSSTSGRQLTCGTAVVEVTDGDGEGDFVSVDLPPEVVGSGVQIGDGLVLTRTVDGGGGGDPSYSFSDFQRTTPIVVLALAFVVVVGLVARLRGLAALVGLGFAFFVLLQFILPGILGSESPTLVTLVGSSAIMFVVLYLAHGFTTRTTTALIGTLFGLVLVAVMGAVAVSSARLLGSSSEATIQLQTFDPSLDFSGLVLAGITVAGLGILDDVTITQASAIWQLDEVDPTMTAGQLFTRGMQVGRDHIASTICTIVFAYTGAALPLLLLIEIYDRPVGVVLTGTEIGEEVIRTLVGAIALILAVPVTTAVGAFFAKAAGTKQAPALLTRFAR